MVAFRVALYAVVAGGVGAMGISAPHAWAQQATASNLASSAPVARATDDSATDNTANDSASDLAKKLQNPVGGLCSFRFRSNANFNCGPSKGTQEILNIEPVILIHVNQDWNIIAANWEVAGNKAWTLPIGGGFGGVVRIGGKLPVKVGHSAYANVLHPKYGATWQLRTQVTLIL